MGRYSFIRAPETSSVRGLGSGLIPTPSLGSYSGVTMPAPLAAAAAAPAAAGGGIMGGLARFAGSFFPNLLAEVVGASMKPGGLTPSSPTTPSQVKYNLTSADVQSYVRMADEINYRRRQLNMLGANLPMISPEELIAEEVETNRLLMKEAGEREYAIEQLKQQGGVQQSLANQIGAGLQAQSGATQQMIESMLKRRNIDPQDAELARAF